MQFSPLPNSSSCKRSLQWIVGQVQGIWLLLQHQCWTVTETSLRYPAILLSNRDPAVMVLHDQCLLTQRQVIDVGVGQLKALDVKLGGN